MAFSTALLAEPAQHVPVATSKANVSDGHQLLSCTAAAAIGVQGTHLLFKPLYLHVLWTEVPVEVKAAFSCIHHSKRRWSCLGGQ
jgi:hypothetical protein